MEDTADEGEPTPRDWRPRSLPAVLGIALLVGTLFAGLTLESAWRNSNGLSPAQQEAVHEHLQACLNAVDVLNDFHQAEARWPTDEADLIASDATPASVPHDGLGKPFRYSLASGKPRMTSDGLDGQPGGTGDAADLWFELTAPPPPAGRSSTLPWAASPSPVGTRWAFLTRNAAPQILAGAGFAGLLVSGMTLPGLLGDRDRPDPTRLPTTLGGWFGLVGGGFLVFLGLALAALVIGFLMAAMHGWAGTH